METTRLFVLGGSGFIGREVIRAAVERGWEVRALARTAESAERVRALGASPVQGDARAPRDWRDLVRGADVLVDLAQPELPSRIGWRDIERVSRERQAMTRDLLAVLQGLAPGERPLLLSVSGVDDLAPDASGRIDGSSPLRSLPVGFGRVGAPVRRLIERAGVATAFLYLGTVYGPGKSFAHAVFPRLARGRMLLPAPARNRLPLIHVRDAGRAIVHLAGIERERLLGTSWILVDEEGGARLGDFFDRAAALIEVAPPHRVPRWFLSVVMGRILLETIARDVAAAPAELLATGFRFEVPTVREGLPATLAALGYPLHETTAATRRRRRPERWLLAASAAAIAAVNTLDLPLTARRLSALAGGEPVLDLRIGYGASEAYRFLDALGSAGRTAYLEMLWTVDLVLPMLFAAALWSALRAGALGRWRWLALAAAAADYLENGALSALLLAYPGRSTWLPLLAGFLTCVKFSLYVGAALLAVYGARPLRKPSRHPSASPQEPR